MTILLSVRPPAGRVPTVEEARLVSVLVRLQWLMPLVAGYTSWSYVDQVFREELRNYLEGP